MKIRAIALNTCAGLIRNRLIVLFCGLFLCVLLLMMTPLLFARGLSGTIGSASSDQMVLGIVAGITSLLSGFGSLLAAWAAADSLASEIKSGSILAVLARPVARWEFLLGKFLGVMLLMSIYVVFMIGMTYGLGALGGDFIRTSPLTLFVYPMTRYAIYAAIALLCTARMHPILAFVIVLVIAVTISMVSPQESSRKIPAAIRYPIYIVLPSTGLLSESRFLELNKGSLNLVPWTQHATALAYGLDYAAVFFLLAVWAFGRRPLTRE